MDHDPQGKNWYIKGTDDGTGKRSAGYRADHVEAHLEEVRLGEGGPLSRSASSTKDQKFNSRFSRA
jgi:hypothetical protein